METHELQFLHEVLKDNLIFHQYRDWMLGATQCAPPNISPLTEKTEKALNMILGEMKKPVA